MPRRSILILALLAFGPGASVDAGPLKKTSDADGARRALRDNDAILDGIKAKMDPLIEIQRNLMNMRMALNDMQYKMRTIRNSNKLADAVWCADLVGTVGGLATGGFAALAEQGLKEAAKAVIKSAAINTAKDLANLTPGSMAVYVDRAYSSSAMGRTAGSGEGSAYVKLEELGERIREIWKNRAPGDAGRDAAMREIGSMIVDLEGQVDNGYTTAEAKVVELAKEAAKWEAEGELIRAELKEYEKDEPAKQRDATAKVLNDQKKDEAKAVDRDRQTTVTPPPAAPKESEEDKRRKLQGAIDSTVDAAARKATDLNLKADYALDEAMKASLGMGLDAAYSFQRLSELSPDPLCERYEDCVRREKAARRYAEEIDGQRGKTQGYLSDLAAKVKPILNEELAGVLSDWWGVYNKYQPLGFRVGKPPEFASLGAVDTYLRQGAYAQAFLTQTDKFGQQALETAGKATEKRGQIVSAAAKFGGELKNAVAEAREARQLFRSEVEKMVDTLNAEAAPANGFSWQIVSAASANGDKDLARLRREFGSLAGSAQKVDDLQWGIATLYNNLHPRLQRLKAMGDDPLLWEYQYISQAGEEQDKRACAGKIPDASEIAAAACAGCGYEDDKSVTPLESLVSAATSVKHSVLKAVRDGDATLSYLEGADAESRKILGAASAALKAGTAGDHAAMKAMTDAEYAAAAAKLDEPVAKAEQQLDAIQQAIRRMPFFAADPADLKPMDVKTESGPYGPVVAGGPAPLLWQTGFRSKAVQALYEELERTKSEFWSKGAGYEANEARRAAKEAAKQSEGPGPATPEEAAQVRAFYDRFAKAYESRDDAGVMSLVSDDWHASDGTSTAGLQDNLRRSFRMFDDISFRIENLRVRRLLPHHYQAEYDATIVSRIYKRNLKHEEKSAVSEEVGSDPSGKLKLEGTLNGRYWYVK